MIIDVIKHFRILDGKSEFSLLFLSLILFVLVLQFSLLCIHLLTDYPFKSYKRSWQTTDLTLKYHPTLDFPHKYDLDLESGVQVSLNHVKRQSSIFLWNASLIRCKITENYFDSAVLMRPGSFCSCGYLRENKSICKNTSAYEYVHEKGVQIFKTPSPF